MKKTIGLLLIFIFLIFNTVVYASSEITAKFEADKMNLKSGENVEVILKLQDFDEKAKGINVLLGKLEYDKNVFEEIVDADITPIQYWGATTYNFQNGKLLIDANTFVNSPHNALKVKLKVKDNIAQNLETKFILKDISASDGEKDIELNDAIVVFNVDKANDTANVNDIIEENRVSITVAAAFGILLLGIVLIVLVKRNDEK